MDDFHEASMMASCASMEYALDDSVPKSSVKATSKVLRTGGRLIRFNLLRFEIMIGNKQGARKKVLNLV